MVNNDAGCMSNKLWSRLPLTCQFLRDGKKCVVCQHAYYKSLNSLASLVALQLTVDQTLS